MIKFVKQTLKKFLNKSGYKLTRISPFEIQNDNPFLAIKGSLSTNVPIIFDVGMNHGQTLNKIRTVFPKAVIHGFEPSKHCFEDLKVKFSESSIILNNMGVSDANGVLELNELTQRLLII